MQQIIYKLDKVGKTYRQGREQVVVLDKLTLDIYQGDFIGVMGPSGSGKTTLLNLLGGIDSFDSGNMLYQGRSLRELNQSELAAWRAANVAFVFQAYNLVSTLTAQQNVALPLMLTNLSRKQQRLRVDAALELVGLRDRATHKPAELSGGQQQRVAIARALVADAPVLLCDEPTGNLDRKATFEIMAILETLHQKYKKTIVMVTHDAEVASMLPRKVNLTAASPDISLTA